MLANPKHFLVLNTFVINVYQEDLFRQLPRYSGEENWPEVPQILFLSIP